MPPHYEFSLVTDGPPGTAGASSAGALDGSSRLSAAESAALHHVLGSRNTFVDLARTICSIHPYRRDEEEIDQLGYLAEQLAVCFGTGKLELTDYAKRDAWQFMTIRKCDANKPVIKAGQKHGTLLIVLSGAVKIVPGPGAKANDEPRELEFGQCFGGETLRDDDERAPYTVTALERTQLLVLKKKHFDWVTREHARAEAAGRFDFLRDLPVCGLWSDDAVQLLCRQSSLHYCRANARLLQQGAECDFVHIIRAGTVSVIKAVPMPDGRRRRVEIARVGPRQHFSSCYQEAAKTGGGGPAQQTQTRTAAFGSISWKTNVIAAGAVAPFTVVARGDVEMIRIPLAHFLFFMKDDGDRMRQFGATAPTLPTDDRTRQCALAQMQWSKYQSQLVGSIMTGEGHGAKLKEHAKKVNSRRTLEESLSEDGSQAQKKMPRLYAATKSFRHRMQQTLAHRLETPMSTAATAVQAARSFVRGDQHASGGTRRPQSLPNLQLPWSMSPVPKDTVADVMASPFVSLAMPRRQSNASSHSSAADRSTSGVGRVHRPRVAMRDSIAHGPAAMLMQESGRHSPTMLKATMSEP